MAFLTRYTRPIMILFGLMIISMGIIGCSDDNDPTGPGGNAPNLELFPGLSKEEWYYFDQNHILDHYEVFTYHYDGSRRVSADFFNSAMGIPFTITYNYDQGKIVNELWSSAFAPITWTSVYVYNTEGTRVLGANGIGAFSYELRYQFDANGRRIGSVMNSITPPGGYTLTHHYNNNGKCFQATGTEALRGLEVVVVYTY